MTGAKTTAQTWLFGFGWNEHGNLGLGHTRNVPQPTLLPWSNLWAPPTSTGSETCAASQDAAAVALESGGAFVQIHWAGTDPLDATATIGEQEETG